MAHASLLPVPCGAGRPPSSWLLNVFVDPWGLGSQSAVDLGLAVMSGSAGLLVGQAGKHESTPRKRVP